MRVGFVTEELSVFGRSGGIGAAIYELAGCLSSNDIDVDIHYYPHRSIDVDERSKIKEWFLDRSINLIIIDGKEFVHDQSSPQARSYVVYQHLSSYGKIYDYIHFHDYKGMGFFCCAAKKMGLKFHDTTLVTQLHGPTRWAIQANRGLFTHPDQILIDHLERESIRLADEVVSPSAYLVEWLGANGFDLPGKGHVHVIKNVFGESNKITKHTGPANSHRTAIHDIIFFGRHEGRKGLVTFCDALDRCDRALADRNIRVCFLGGLGEINGQASGIYLSRRAAKWSFAFDFFVGMNRAESFKFLSSETNSLVVIPSSAENSPYTVVEAISAGRPVLTSLAGGAKELIDPACHAEAIVDINAENLATRILHLVENGVRQTRFAEDADTVVQKWLKFHKSVPKTKKPPLHSASPKVVVGITHFDRPAKLIGAIMSVARQTYENVELCVLDDGSKQQSTLDALPGIEALVRKLGGRFITQKNGYLGAARNAIARATSSDYLIFLDDDDLLLPNAIEQLVEAARHSDADIVGCLSVFMDVESRAPFELAPERHHKKVSYVPVGGPLSLAPIVNHFGSATALFKRKFFQTLGGYSEIKGVGYEDYEFYARSAQAKAKIFVLPEPLFLYEIGRASMISSTPRMANSLRILEFLDISKNASAWRDTIEVVAGKQTLEEQTRDINWQNSSSPQSDIIKKIFDYRNELHKEIECLIEYCDAVDALSVAQAWQRAANLIKRKGEMQAAVARTRIGRSHKSFTGNVSLVENPPLLTDLAALVVLDRQDELAQRIVAELQRTHQVDPAIISYLYQITGSNSNSDQSKRLLVDELMGADVAPNLARSLRGAVSALCFVLGDAQAGLYHLLVVLREETNEYIGRYEDIRRICADGADSQALEHFEHHGVHEERSGFEIASRVRDEVSRGLNRNFRIADLIHRSDRLFEDRSLRGSSVKEVAVAG